MNKTQLNKQANILLKKYFYDNDITRCEMCGSDQWLTFAHRKKRRHYQTVEELSDPNEVLLLCICCHQRIEYNKELTRETFRKLRDEIHF